MTFSLTVVILICTLLLFSKKLLKHAKIYFWSLKIPGPLAIPPVGCGYRFLCHREEILNRIRKIFEDFPQPVIKIWLGPKLIVIIREPHHLQTILQSSMTEKDSMMHVTKPFIGEGLITGSGPIWKQHRKLIMPTLGIKAVDVYCDIFHRESAIMVNKMLNDIKNCENAEIVLEDYLHPCSMDIVCDTVLDVKLNAQSSLNQDFMESLYLVYYIAIERMVKPWLYSDFLFQFSSLARKQKKALKVLRSFISDVIEKRKDEKQTEIMVNLIQSKVGTKNDPKTDIVETSMKFEDDPEISENTGKIKNALDQLMDALHDGTLKITDEEMIDEVLTMFMASSDTIASITCFCLNMLAMHPEHQEKVVQEFLKVKSETNEPLNSTTCTKLNYLERCIKETIRLFPIGPFIVRFNRSDFKLDDKLTIPKGLTVMMALFIVHRDPKYWSHADEFYPDHFLPEEVEKRHPFAYLPFSSGLRTCIGKLYAMISIKIMVVKVLENFYIDCKSKTTVKDMILSSDISVRVPGGNKIIIKKRSLQK